MKNRFLALLVVMVMLLSLLISGCDSFGSVKVDITDPPESGTQEVTADVGEEEEEEEGNKEEEEEVEEEEVVVEEEEEEEDNTESNDEPPFLMTLRTGVYGYEEEHIIVKDRTIEGKTFVYSNGSLMAFGVIDDNGEVMNHYIYDYEKNRIYGIYDEAKIYNFKDDIDFHYSYGIPIFHSGLEESGRGTTEFDGETLDYIDCGSGEEDVVRVIIKDGDVYAFQYNNNGWEHTSYLLKTYSSPPDTEYFEIPDDYEQYTG